MSSTHGTTRDFLRKGVLLLGSILAAGLATSTQVTMQLRSSDGACLSANLTDVTVDDPLRFKAK